MYEVIVGNIGTVYTGNDENEAFRAYNEYVSQSLQGCGRASYEPVVLMQDNEIVNEHYGEVENG